jgi:hypothetical protein
MSPDEPLAPAPARRVSLAGSNVLVGVLAFLGGVAATAGVAQFAGGGFWPHPAPRVEALPQPQPSPVALPPGTDLATLAAREQAMAGRLDQLEVRLRDIDGSARTASAYATQAERLMIAFAVRRAIERGMPLGPLEAQLRRRFAEDHGDAVATIVQAAGQPVTLEDLRLALDTIAPRLVAPSGQSWWGGMRGTIGDLVVLRQADSPSPRPADRLKRAQRMLNEGQVEAALAEVAHMPGAGNAQSWVLAARRYIAARTAIREVEVAAMTTPPAG